MRSARDRRRAVVALSGGLDSSVAAALLVREGYQVVGLTLDLDGRGGTVANPSVAAARAVATALDIPLRVFDVSRRFREAVLRPSWEAYAKGKTPNPCVICNAIVKFAALRVVARAEGAHWIATGHYARIVDEEGSARLARAHDRAKDQSYFLFALAQEHLRRVIFPLRDLTKAKVRRLAADLGLPSAAHVESQDACVGAAGEAFPEFLRTFFGAAARPGPLLASDGSVVGEHGGFHRFTVGQRRGLGVATGKPAWVKAIDAARSAVVLSWERDDLLSNGLQSEHMNWHTPQPPRGPFECLAQVRYGHCPVPAVVVPGEGNTASIRFQTPVWAVTPGQAVVLYDGEVVLGGGWIREAVPCET